MKKMKHLMRARLLQYPIHWAVFEMSYRLIIAYRPNETKVGQTMGVGLTFNCSLRYEY